MTGEIKFDNQGLRSEFALDLIELGLSGLIKVGTWNSSEGLNISRANIKPHSGDDDAGSLKNKTFIVLTALVRIDDKHYSRVPAYLFLIESFVAERSLWHVEENGC